MPKNGSTPTVLIIEDNPLNLKLFQDVLSVHGFLTIADETGERAFNLADKYRPDLIVIDLHLPHISGETLIKTFKQDDLLQRIPVLAITADASQEAAACAQRARCDSFLVKPFTIGSFVTTIQSLLKTRKIA